MQRQRYVKLEGPVMVELWFIMPRPKSLKKNAIWHMKKPDIDNLIKGILDACKGLLWNDDGQVCKLEVLKKYASMNSEAIDGDPMVKMTVSEIE